MEDGPDWVSDSLRLFKKCVSINHNLTFKDRDKYFPKKMQMVKMLQFSTSKKILKKEK